MQINSLSLEKKVKKYLNYLIIWILEVTQRKY